MQVHNGVLHCFTQSDINRINALLNQKNLAETRLSSDDIRLLYLFLNSFTQKIEKALRGTKKGGFFSSFSFMCKFLEKIKHFKHMVTTSSAIAVIITSIAVAVGGVGSVVLGSIAAIVAGAGAVFYLGFILRKLYKRKFAKNEEILNSILIKTEDGKYKIKEFNFLSTEERYSSAVYLDLHKSISKLCLNKYSNNLVRCNNTTLQEGANLKININNILNNKIYISNLKHNKISKVFGVKKAKKEIIPSFRF